MNSPLFSNPSLNPSDKFVSFAPSQKEITIIRENPQEKPLSFIGENSRKLPVFFTKKNTILEGNFKGFLALELIKSIFLLSFYLILTVGFYGLFNEFNEGISISEVYLKELAYFNGISAFFLIFLLILIRRKTSAFVKEFRKNGENWLKIENFKEWEENFENKTQAFLAENGVFISKICLLYDCSQLLKLEKQKNVIESEILKEKEIEIQVFLHKKLKEIQEKSDFLRNSDEFKKENFMGKMLVFFDHEYGFFIYFLKKPFYF